MKLNYRSIKFVIFSTCFVFAISQLFSFLLALSSDSGFARELNLAFLSSLAMNMVLPTLAILFGYIILLLVSPRRIELIRPHYLSLMSFLIIVSHAVLLTLLLITSDSPAAGFGIFGLVAYLQFAIFPLAAFLLYLASIKVRFLGPIANIASGVGAVVIILFNNGWSFVYFTGVASWLLVLALIMGPSLGSGEAQPAERKKLPNPIKIAALLLIGLPALLIIGIYIKEFVIEDIKSVIEAEQAMKPDFEYVPGPETESQADNLCWENSGYDLVRLDGNWDQAIMKNGEFVVPSVRTALPTENDVFLRPLSALPDAKKLYFLAGSAQYLEYAERDYFLGTVRSIYSFDLENRTFKKMDIELPVNFAAMKLSPGCRYAASFLEDDLYDFRGVVAELALFDLYNESARSIVTLRGSETLSQSPDFGDEINVRWADVNTIEYAVYDSGRQTSDAEAFPGRYFKDLGTRTYEIGPASF